MTIVKVHNPQLEFYASFKDHLPATDNCDRRFMVVSSEQFGQVEIENDEYKRILGQFKCEGKLRVEEIGNNLAVWEGSRLAQLGRPVTKVPKMRLLSANVKMAMMYGGR